MAVLTSPAGALTLEDALQTLVERHPQIRASESGVAAAESGIGIATSGFLPTVEITGDGGYERSDTPSRRDANQDPFDAASRKLTLSIRQNLFDGYGRNSGLRQAEITRDASRVDLRSVRQTVLLEGVNAYLGLLREHRLVKLATENEQTIARQLGLESERLQGGAGIAVDVLLARARLQIARERRVAFEGARIDAHTRFRQVFDMDVITDTLVEPQLPHSVLPDSLDEAVNNALHGNPGLGRASELVRLADEKRRGATSGYWPRVDLVGRANWERDYDGVPGTRRDGAILLQLTWQIFSGFATDYTVSQSAHDAAASRENETAVRRKTIEEVKLAWQALQTARTREALLTNAVAIASEVFEARKSLRDSGRETALNVLDAENEVYVARINLVAATYDAQAAIYRLIAAIGDMEVENLPKRR
ncbi:TolC family outer membrane protein [Desertibaculum subflavum]|uniref:TolC family outer membrane protein n=1 Tax=Desertibaculum subflavum TaxID=2268458 RepID=UPI0034D32A04